MTSASTTRGRSYFVAIAAVVIATLGLFGAVIGANAQARVDAITVFDAFVVRPTPLVLGALAAGIAALIFVVLFGLVTLASRYDRAAPKN